MNCLFVCTGNTCRSPMAAAYYNHYTKNRGGAQAASCGLRAIEGGALSAGAAAALELAGICPEHSSRPFTAVPAAEYDVIYGMTRAHCASLAEGFPQYAEKIKAFPFDIPDPFGGNDEEYRVCLRHIICGIIIIAQKDENIAYEVIPASHSFIDEMLDIENACFTDPWSRDSLVTHLANEDCVFLAAKDKESGALAGFCGMRIAGGEAEIYTVTVLPGHRRRGIGRQMIGTLLELAAASQTESIFLEVRESNAAAVALYESFGFEIYGKRKKYYKKPVENAVLMRLDLKRGV